MYQATRMPEGAPAGKAARGAQSQRGAGPGVEGGSPRIHERGGRWVEGRAIRRSGGTAVRSLGRVTGKTDPGDRTVGTGLAAPVTQSSGQPGERSAGQCKGDLASPTPALAPEEAVASGTRRPELKTWTRCSSEHTSTDGPSGGGRHHKTPTKLRIPRNGRVVRGPPPPPPHDAPNARSRLRHETAPGDD